MQKMKKLSQRRCRYLGTIVLYLSLISIVIPGQGQETVNLEQAVSQALDNAGNDPVSIEAAIRGVMDQTNPTAAGMKAIASTAMRKVAGYNQRGLMAAVSKGTAGAAISQALKSGVNPLHASASVTEGLVGAATATIARKGGNSAGTAKAVSQATMQAVVETATGLGIPAQDAANASAFGAMNASMDVAVDFATNSATMARDVTAGLTTGAITGAIRQQTDPSAVTKAVLTGAVDSIFGKADENNINPEPLIKAAQAGFNQALTAAGTQGLEKKDAADPNNDIIGAGLKFDAEILVGKIKEKTFVFNGQRTEKFEDNGETNEYDINQTEKRDGLIYLIDSEVVLTNAILTNDNWHVQLDLLDDATSEKFNYELYLENVLVDTSNIPIFDIGKEINDLNKGKYRIDAINKENNEKSISKTKIVNLEQKPVPLPPTPLPPTPITPTPSPELDGNLIMVAGETYEVQFIQTTFKNINPEDVVYEFYRDGAKIAGPLNEPVFNLGQKLTVANVGTYRIVAKTKDGVELVSKSRLISLINEPLPPVSPSS
jgi:hypothetical protein